jgi:mycothiol synthase
VIHEALLRGLPEGGVMWLAAAGRSLWPLLRDGDSLRVVRVTGEAALAPGDVAVVKLPSGVLAAHLVVSTAPLQTASTAGVPDPLPLEPLARVTGFRRGELVRPWPRATRLVLRWWPASARQLKRVPGLRALVRRLRD